MQAELHGACSWGGILELCRPCPSLEDVPVVPSAIAALAKGLRSVAAALGRGCLSPKSEAQSLVQCRR